MLNASSSIDIKAHPAFSLCIYVGNFWGLLVNKGPKQYSLIFQCVNDAIKLVAVLVEQC